MQGQQQQHAQAAMVEYNAANEKQGNVMDSNIWQGLISTHGRQFFSCLKFITFDRDWHLGSPFVQKVVFKTLRVPERDQKEWWGRWCGELKSTMEARRNGIINAIKEAFMGKMKRAHCSVR